MPGNCIYVVEPGPLVVFVAGIKNSAITVESSFILTEPLRLIKGFSVKMRVLQRLIRSLLMF